MQRRQAETGPDPDQQAAQADPDQRTDPGSELLEAVEGRKDRMKVVPDAHSLVLPVSRVPGKQATDTIPCLETGRS